MEFQPGQEVETKGKRIVEFSKTRTKLSIALSLSKGRIVGGSIQDMEAAKKVLKASNA